MSDAVCCRRPLVNVVYSRRASQDASVNRRAANPDRRGDGGAGRLLPFEMAEQAAKDAAAWIARGGC
jgi:hypothetical protein